MRALFQLHILRKLQLLLSFNYCSFERRHTFLISYSETEYRSEYFDL